MKTITIFIYSIFSFIMMFWYQNCGGQMRSLNSGLYSPLSDGCFENLKPSYKNGFYPFFKSNCAGCHQTVSQQGGHLLFNSDNFDEAYEAFLTRPVTRYKDQVLSDHKKNYSESVHAQAISILESWNNDLKICSSSIVTDNKSITTNEISSPLLVDFGDDNKADCYNQISDSLNPSFLISGQDVQRSKVATLTWDLSQTRSDLSGVKLKLDLLISSSSLPLPSDNLPQGKLCPASGYEFGNLRFDSNKKLSVKNVAIYLNNSDHGLARLQVSGKTILPGTDIPLSHGDGTSTIPVNYFMKLDKWKINIGEIVEVN